MKFCPSNSIPDRSKLQASQYVYDTLSFIEIPFINVVPYVNNIMSFDISGICNMTLLA